ncbi:hypothetical protein [Actibacterium pelagium]|uniref:Uncharacterized protein n=1 Tax=Actibacterium pelagium TaxID=2029103 RepID=A0A917EHJ2_9RHOB|nr:hypothetical protein [Actibacterium pelagium]GGE40996.1 hypothetical protein GCM10011517_05810 [Actibacterium pelagium]
MNLDRIINMIVRRVLGRIINMGVNKGFDVAGEQFNRMTKKSDSAPEPARKSEEPGDIQAFGLFDEEEPEPKPRKRRG